MTTQRAVRVASSAGFHARPAAAFAAAAARFRSDITVHKGAANVDAKSALLLMTLDVRQGDRIEVRADGPDAEAAVKELVRLAALS